MITNILCVPENIILLDELSNIAIFLLRVILVLRS